MGIYLTEHKKLTLGSKAFLSCDISIDGKQYSVDSSRLSWTERNRFTNTAAKSLYLITVPVDIVTTPLIVLGAMLTSPFR